MTGNKSKIINDPLHGFLALPSAIIYDVIQHPYFQRLRRIRQLGMSEWVYPGATHTRFHHALGALNLTIQAVETLQRKGVDITEEEKEEIDEDNIDIDFLDDSDEWSSEYETSYELLCGCDLECLES